MAGLAETRLFFLVLIAVSGLAWIVWLGRLWRSHRG